MTKAPEDGFKLSPPEGLRVTFLNVDQEEYAIFSYPLPRLAMPSFLSPAESVVAEALLQGDSYKQIAAKRGTSERTVANQVRSIFGKCGVTSRIALAALLNRSEAQR